VASESAPSDSTEKGIPNIRAEIVRPNNPATAELNMYHKMTLVANFPARPLLIIVAMAGLRAAKMRMGTNRMINFINMAVPADMGFNVPGKIPPMTMPEIRAVKVQIYVGMDLMVFIYVIIPFIA